MEVRSFARTGVGLKVGAGHSALVEHAADAEELGQPGSTYRVEELLIDGYWDGRRGRPANRAPQLQALSSIHKAVERQHRGVDYLPGAGAQYAKRLQADAGVVS